MSEIFLAVISFTRFRYECLIYIVHERLLTESTEVIHPSTQNNSFKQLVFFYQHEQKMADGQIGESTDLFKLFVGQIPKEMDEVALRQYFEEFGPIVEVSIIRDNITMLSKGNVNSSQRMDDVFVFLHTASCLLCDPKLIII